MSTIGPGDLVVCVDNRPMPWHSPITAAYIRYALKIGGKYKVVGWGKNGLRTGQTIFVAGVPAPGHADGWGWIVSRFRKLDSKGDENWLKEILTKHRSRPKVRERETEGA